MLPSIPMSFLNRKKLMSLTNNTWIIECSQKNSILTEEKTRGNKIEKKLKNKEEKKKTNKKRASSCQKIKSKEPNTYSFSVVVTQWPIFFPLRLFHHNDAFAASSTLLQWFKFQWQNHPYCNCPPTYLTNLPLLVA